MNNKSNWKKFQLSMNNFHINKLISYTDICHCFNKAFDNADSKDKNYYYAKRINTMVKSINHRNDFVLNTKHNQELFHYIKNCMVNIIGSVKISDPTINMLNNTFNSMDAGLKHKFNLTAHKEYHMSPQQVLINHMRNSLHNEN